MEEIAELDEQLRKHVETSLADALGTPVDALMTDARVRALRLTGQILEPHLRSFAQALCDEMPRDEWLAHLAMLVANKPMASWSDDDRARFDPPSVLFR